MITINTLRFSHWLVLMTLAIVFFASSRPISMQEKYIEQYKYIAVGEMERTGVPASIKMAQALLESHSGKSELAKNANNHFGIKCKPEWTGNIYYYHDDDKNKEGKIIASCFRSYSDPMDSYKDHSDFLANRARYKELFSLDKTDYIGWAQGLKRCGYATDPNYADLLIKIVNRYNLDNLDYMASGITEKETLKKDSLVENRIEKPISPMVPKNVVIAIPKTVPKNIIKTSHKSKQKHKRKRRN